MAIQSIADRQSPDNITAAMIFGLAELFTAPLLVLGPGSLDRSDGWINRNTQRALLARRLAAHKSDPLHRRSWLVITPAGKLVVKAYLLGAASNAESQPRTDEKRGLS